MKKKEQVAVFFILGLTLVIIVGLSYYSIRYGAKKTGTAAAVKETQSSRSEIVKNYAEACIKEIAEKSLFDSVGLQGGYLDQSDIPNPPIALFDGKNVPYYIRASCSPNCIYDAQFPQLSEISAKLSAKMQDEFKNCFDKNAFGSIGLSVLETGIPKAEIGINEEDITIRLDDEFVVKENGKETRLDSFSITLPIRLKALHESAVDFVNKIKNSNSNKYIITSQDCTSFDKNGLTNVYVRNLPNGKIIRFFDYSTYYQKYLNAYVFQFATDVDVSGQCTG